jgi:hypothetical protein
MKPLLMLPNWTEVKAYFVGDVSVTLLYVEALSVTMHILIVACYIAPC